MAKDLYNDSSYPTLYSSVQNSTTDTKRRDQLSGVEPSEEPTNKKKETEKNLNLGLVLFFFSFFFFLVEYRIQRTSN